VGFASPKGGANNSKDRTLTVSVKSRQTEVVDVGRKGPSQGDMRVVNAPLYDESGTQKVGRLDLNCVATDPANKPNEKANMAECAYTYTLQNGEISAQGVSALPRALDAITGGTSKYAGVQGEVSVRTRGNTAVATFHFID
jgi:hypothetical protein